MHLADWFILNDSKALTKRDVNKTFQVSTKKALRSYLALLVVAYSTEGRRELDQSSLPGGLCVTLSGMGLVSMHVYMCGICVKFALWCLR